MTGEERTVQVPVSLPTREQIAEAHRYQEGDAGDGYTEPREWWASCSCGASLAEWQQFYNESDEDPHKMYALHLVDAVLALLSQPTPTAEPIDAVSASCVDGATPEQQREIAEPPRIEDMAPGTTFTGTTRRGHTLSLRYLGDARVRDLVAGLSFNVNDAAGLSRIDPSTIRDVTPPAVTS